MFDEKRKFEEVMALAELEPELRNIYVEGVTDKIFINDYLENQQVENIKTYFIDQIDFSLIYTQMNPTQVQQFEENNKERVIYLANELEKRFGKALSHTICVIDVDMDYVLNNVRTGSYIVYTDYNSMELYLWSFNAISRFLVIGHHVTKPVNISSFLNSLQAVCRQVFFIRCILFQHGGSIIENDKEFSFDKQTFTCKLDINKYWEKVIQKNGLSLESQKLRKIFDDSYNNSTLDPKKEMRGHDFVHYLYLCIKSYKKSLRMSEEEFANLLWGFADYSELSQKSLFQKVIAL